MRGLAFGLLGIGSLAIVGSGVGLAVAANSGATFHGCKAKSDGALRIVTSANDCTAHEKAISWHQGGPQGLRGAKGSAGHSPTFQMFANVREDGKLGANFEATKAVENGAATASGVSYIVTFSKPIGSCAARVQPGYARGSDGLEAAPSEVVNSGSHGFEVLFTPGRGTEASAFMMTVTCPS